MLAALEHHMPDTVRWETPQGGMFIWLSLPEGADATALLPLALARKVAYVPGTAFYAAGPAPRTRSRSGPRAADSVPRSSSHTGRDGAPPPPSRSLPGS